MKDVHLNGGNSGIDCGTEKARMTVINNKSSEYYWVAAYTNPRSEKKVQELIKTHGVESYLPLVKNLKQWSDRKKWVEEPLFRSYIFVKLSEKEYLDVLSIPGIVRFITFSGKAAVIPEAQIELIRRLLITEKDLSVVSERFAPGERIIIASGHLMGIEGEIIEYQSKKKVLIRIDHLEQSVLLNISAAFLEAVA
jgi:transcription antitermination factor NusG